MDISQICDSFQSNANSDWNRISLVSYWKIGQRIVEVEQGNQEGASYGDRILIQLSKDLNKRFGRIFRIGTCVLCDVSFNFINLGKFVPNFLGLIGSFC
ncbi:PF06250 domain protein [Leptospira santarosai str. 200702252]|nr:PF06250 domain protein [Leptospira santarosai str. 200403458]EMP00110.1 PF06250 domain protein [Leptospira santarosai str. 200702252]